MVTVIEAVERKNSNGDKFTALILTGGVEMVKSQKGKHYATVRKASVPSTIDLQIAKRLIGQQMPGSIVKKICEPYKYKTQGGEEIEIDFTYEYNEAATSIEESVFN